MGFLFHLEDDIIEGGQKKENADTCSGILQGHVEKVHRDGVQVTSSFNFSVKFAMNATHIQHKAKFSPVGLVLYK